MSQIYVNLDTILTQKGISKNQLQKHCNLQRTQLNKYCRNEIARIDLSILSRLCEYLECEPGDILVFKQ